MFYPKSWDSVSDDHVFSLYFTDKRLASLTSVSLEEVARPHEITEDLNVNPEDDPVYFIAILIECLAMLRKLPEAIDVSMSLISL